MTAIEGDGWITSDRRKMIICMDHDSINSDVEISNQSVLD